MYLWGNGNFPGILSGLPRGAELSDFFRWATPRVLKSMLLEACGSFRALPPPRRALPPPRREPPPPRRFAEQPQRGPLRERRGGTRTSKNDVEVK